MNNTQTAAPLPGLRRIMERHGIIPRKALGQNFLLDPGLTRRIARSAGPLEGVTIIEVGPGPGGLTRALMAEGAARVVAIERDQRCIPALRELAAHYPAGRLEIVEGDALGIDASQFAAGPVRIVANLPYNIATALFVGWIGGLSWPPWYESMILMFQKEVAERLTAEPGGRSYGRLSVLAQWRNEVRALFDVGAAAFTPPPKVTSTVIRAVPRLRPHPVGHIDALGRITAAAFGQRRKMLRSSLKAACHDPQPLFDCTGITPTLRAERLTVAQFCALARSLHALQSSLR